MRHAVRLGLGPRLRLGPGFIAPLAPVAPLSSLALLVASLAACSPAAAPCPAPAAPASPPSTPLAATPAPGSPAGDADVALLLRPSPTPAPLVHVELALAKTDPGWTAFRITSASPDHVTHAVARDASGELAVRVTGAPPGVVLQLGRAPSGGLALAYDVLSGGDAPDDPLGLLVLDDRFRGAGERLVALPDALPDRRANVLVRIDGELLRASGAASSLGVGAARRTQIPPRALRYAGFLAGSLGVEVIDDPAAGHDEGAWLGYTAFDPRPAVAELAQVRSALRELLRSGIDAPPWTYLLMSQTRPLGSFTTTPRVQSSLLQVGPAEPWGAALRLSLTQQLARYFIGGVQRVAPEPGHEAETGWFTEGVSRYVAMVALSHVGLLTPDDVRDAIGGELSVLATSPDGSLGSARLAAMQGDPVARATLMARGALYAQRESAAIRARSKGERGLITVLGELERQVEERPDHGPTTLKAWLDALGKDDPDAAKTFDALVVRGDPVILPAGALGPCFRAGTGEYAGYDPGFDLEATRAAPDGRVVGVRPAGPAAKAGLRDGDVLESMTAHDGSADAPVKLTVTRSEADASGSAGARVNAKMTLTYVPRGPHGRGQTWTRLRDLPDDRCGEAL